ncbi:unnamed protein product [Ixodes hexagonus]
MVDKIVYTESRLRQVHFPGVLYYGRSVWYTARRPSRRADALLHEAPLTFFTFLGISIVACVLCFCLINYCSRRDVLSDVQDLAMVLVSTAMLFAYPVPQRFERFMAGRIVLFCWMAGGFSLAVYFQSLLTSSLSSGYGWDADDTIEKLYPKLATGKLLPCVKKGTYFDRLLLQSIGKQDILGAMAAARSRASNKNSTISNTIAGCMNKVVRGGHVLVSFDFGDCARGEFGSTVTLGKDSIHTLYGSTPVRKNFPLRDSYGKLVSSIFETGWELRALNLFNWNCSRFGDRELSVSSYDATQFLPVYYMSCGVAAIVFVAELLMSHVF